MGDLFVFIMESIKERWVAAVLIVLVVLWHTGVLPSIMGTTARMAKQQQDMWEFLQKEITRLESERRRDQEDCDRRIAQLTAAYQQRIEDVREECVRDTRQLTDAVATLTKGEQRWRHLAANIAQYVYHLRERMMVQGMDLPRFHGWDNFVNAGGSADDIAHMNLDGERRRDG